MFRRFKYQSLNDSFDEFLNYETESRVSFLDSNEGKVGYSTFDVEERKKLREAR